MGITQFFSNGYRIRQIFSLGMMTALLTVVSTPGYALTQNEVQKLLASDGKIEDRFGFPLAVSGDTAVISAPTNFGNVGTGSAYVFTRDDNEGWTQQAKLLPIDEFIAFGGSVALSGNTAVISSNDDDNGANSGSAYVFTRDGNGVWTQQTKLLASDGAGGDAFGASIALSGNTAVIGASGDGDNGNASGSAYVFTRDGNGVWTQQAKLLASDGATNDQFGRSLALSGDTAVIGTRNDDVNGIVSGSAYVFTRDGNGVWTQQAKLLASDRASGDAFGASLALSGNTAVFGASGDGDNGNRSGSAYVFTRDGNGVWTQQAKLLASDGASVDLFGVSVSLSGNTAVIGALGDDDNGANSGSAYVFTRDGNGVWTQQTKLLASDGAGGDQFGISIGLSGNTAVIGAFFDGDNGIRSGSAYAFTIGESAVLFREKSGDNKDGTWGFLIDEIPGFDHTALAVNNLVYESHPGYPAGVYVSEDSTEVAVVSEIFGVQAQHTNKTFEYDTIQGAGNSPVIDFEAIPISLQLGMDMQEQIQPLITQGARFQQIDFSTPRGIRATLSPSAQKGEDGSFTCVGLVEWAAEQAEHNDGQGFIRNVFESFNYLDLTVFPPETRELPLLSPQLLNFAMKSSLTIESVQQWFQGAFDPVDFLVIDPLGRRLGFVDVLGEMREIPRAFFSGDGRFEQFLIPNPVPGIYMIELIGLGEEVSGAVSSNSQAAGIDMFLPVGSSEIIIFEIELFPGAPGDVNVDGLIDGQDQNELSALLGTPASGPNDPGDIDGDGALSEADIALLQELIQVLENGVDLDGDGVPDDQDACPNTPAGAAVDSNGCAESQKDDDGDGVTNDLDLCSGTPAGATVDVNGCSESQLDDDGDGVTNDLDLCPGTPTGEAVDANGCAESQLDNDGDGVTNDLDQCPGTPAGATVDTNGCAESQKDDDGDGVTNDLDLCPDTPSGAVVDETGCPLGQSNVAIDIRPFSTKNLIWPRSWFFVPVAILGSQDFDISNVDTSTVRFGPNDAIAIRWLTVKRDVNRDGISDLILLFKIRKTGIECGDTEATLTGDTISGTQFTGSDTIKTIKCH